MKTAPYGMLSSINFSFPLMYIVYNVQCHKNLDKEVNRLHKSILSLKHLYICLYLNIWSD